MQFMRSRQHPRRFFRGFIMAAAAAVVVSTLSGAPASAALPKVIVESGTFHGYILCASPDDQSVWLKPNNPQDAYCKWQVFGSSGQFTLYNPAKEQVMAYTGGNQGAVVMQDQGTSPLGENGQLWSWGGWEDWEARALRSFWDDGQNVDAKAPDGEYPRADPVHTRGWRHGHQRELTWNVTVVS